MAEVRQMAPQRLEVRTLGVRPLRVVRLQLGVSQETMSRMLDVSSRTIERWESAGVEPGTPEAVRRYALLSEIVDLAEEVHGGEVERFMATPRRGLGMRTPREAMARGDLDDVRQILIDALEGHWA